jgi:hypothetical protein
MSFSMKIIILFLFVTVPEVCYRPGMYWQILPSYGATPQTLHFGHSHCKEVVLVSRPLQGKTKG